jgi:hypothetical protein
MIFDIYYYYQEHTKQITLVPEVKAALYKDKPQASNTIYH